MLTESFFQQNSKLLHSAWTSVKEKETLTESLQQNITANIPSHWMISCKIASNGGVGAVHINLHLRNIKCELEGYSLVF